MISSNRHWPRWVHASIAKHFETILGNQLHLYVEGEKRQTENQENYCELRIDGPDSNQLSPKLFKLNVTIDALIVNIKSDKNSHIHLDFVGLVLTTFTNAITVYRYGTGLDDDQTELGCLKLMPDASKDKVQVTRLGQTVPAELLQETSIEASYEMLISI